MYDPLTPEQIQDAVEARIASEDDLPDPTMLGKVLARNEATRDLVLRSMGDPIAFFHGFQLGYLVARRREKWQSKTTTLA